MKLAIQLLAIHKANPARVSYANESILKEYTLLEIDAAYRTLEEKGLVFRPGPLSMPEAQPRQCWKITGKGLQAEGLP